MAFSRGTRPTRNPALRGKPTCNNCRDDNCNRCPTAITHHGQSSWTSDFDCACYERDPDTHAELVETDDEEFNQQRRDDGRWDSVGGQFNW